jgi:hypothetical protein
VSCRCCFNLVAPTAMSTHSLLSHQTTHVVTSPRRRLGRMTMPTQRPDLRVLALCGPLVWTQLWLATIFWPVLLYDYISYLQAIGEPPGSTLQRAPSDGVKHGGRGPLCPPPPFPLPPLVSIRCLTNPTLRSPTPHTRSQYLALLAVPAAPARAAGPAAARRAHVRRGGQGPLLPLPHPTAP